MRACKGENLGRVYWRLESLFGSLLGKWGQKVANCFTKSVSNFERTWEGSNKVFATQPKPYLEK